jgi:glycosyltransferase involved in cell wall biosynthesis
VLTNAQGKGVVGAANTGLAAATGTYIARMDQDDVSLPERLQRQVQFMETHPQVGACGTWFRYLATQEVVRHPESHADIKIKLLGNTALAHPSVMMRRSVLVQSGLRYDTAFDCAEDYHLWIRLAAVTELANIPEILLEYRMHAAQLSQQFSPTQLAQSRQVRLMQAQALGLRLAPEEEDLYLALVMATPPDQTQLPAARKLVARVLAAAQVNGTYATPKLQEFFEQVLSKMPPPPTPSDRRRSLVARVQQVIHG